MHPCHFHTEEDERKKEKRKKEEEKTLSRHYEMSARGTTVILILYSVSVYIELAKVTCGRGFLCGKKCRTLLL